MKTLILSLALIVSACGGSASPEFVPATGCESGHVVRFDEGNSACAEQCTSRSLCCIVGDDGNMGAGITSEEGCAMAEDFGFEISEAAE
jgi:hypothetical protein